MVEEREREIKKDGQKKWLVCDDGWGDAVEYV